MTEEESKALHLFEHQTRQLLAHCEAQRQTNLSLQAALQETQSREAQLQQQLTELQESYRRLKMAKIIEIETGDAQLAQKRITKLIHEIDKCIALLNL